MQFLYPAIQQFPFDKVCSCIVKELELRNWQVSGITVTFYEYGSGEERYRMVDSITGNDFCLRFGRSQGRRPNAYYNNIAAVSTLVIPRERLNVYDDESGPTYWRYAGANYEDERDKFVTSYSLYAIRGKRAVSCAEYTGGCNCAATHGASFSALPFLTGAVTGDYEALSQLSHTHRGRRSPLLVPEGESRTTEATNQVFCTKEVMVRFAQYLQMNCISSIKQCG